MNMRKLRNERGISTVVLVLFLALFLLLPLGLLGYEISRFLLICQELHSVTDAAALSGTAAMASSPQTLTYAQRETLAMNVCVQTFQFNSIINDPLLTAVVAAHYDDGTPANQWFTPGLKQAILNIVLLDNTGAAVSLGTAAATMQVHSFFSEAPVFSSYVGAVGTNGFFSSLGQFTANAVSNGGLPMIDMSLCFDASGSMDDQTNAFFINRYWDRANTVIKYGTPSGTSSNTIYNLCQLDPEQTYTGTGLNIYPPMNLSYASYGPGMLSNGQVFYWSETPGGVVPPAAKETGLRADFADYGASAMPMPEQGLPPGNYWKGNIGNQNPAYTGQNPAVQTQAYTDLVMDFGYPATVNGFSFPNQYVALEAARGNLESNTVFAQAMGTGGSIPVQLAGVTPSAGYFNAYWSNVLNNASPIAQGRTAALNFFSTMHISANSHFELVTFSDSAGNGPTGVTPGGTGTWQNGAATVYQLDNGYPMPGSVDKGIFPEPYIALSSTSDNFNACAGPGGAITGTATAPSATAAGPVVALGGTDIADSLQQSLTDLTSNARAGAKKAIVLFTDGVPNKPVDATTGFNDAINEATAANGDGIPIYCIGLSANAGIVSKEDAMLSDGKVTPDHGIAYTSGNGAIYVRVSNASQLNAAFQTIARSLCVLQ